MKTSHFTVPIWLIIVSALVVSLATLLIPLPEGQNWLTFHASIAIPVFNLGLFLPGAALFLTGLSSFKKRLRVAYMFICAGFSLIALGTVQYPVIGLLGWGASAWVTEGWIESPFLLGTVCTFIGAWLYARIVGIRRWFTSLPFMVGAVLLVTFLATRLPHGDLGMPEDILDLLLAFNAWEGTFLIAAGLLLLAIKRRTNLIYIRAMAWLFIAITLCAIGCYLIMTALLTAGPTTWYLVNNVFLVPMIISGFAWLKSAEAFHNVASGSDIPLMPIQGDHTFFGKTHVTEPDRDLLCTDIVSYAASLSSDVHAIDPILDTMRVITANKQGGNDFTPQDQEALADVYLQLEKYLTEKEQVRNFAKELLRELISTRYKESVNAPYFWQKIDSKAAAAAAAAATAADMTAPASPATQADEAALTATPAPEAASEPAPVAATNSAADTTPVSEPAGDAPESAAEPSAAPAHDNAATADAAPSDAPAAPSSESATATDASDDDSSKPADPKNPAAPAPSA